jgi:hypothetical protein
MRILWTLFKIIVGLALAVAAGAVAMVLLAGVLGTMIGLAALAIRLAVFGLIGYGIYRVARFVFGSSPKPAPPVRELPAVDPYYEAAVREVDAHIDGRVR